MSFPYMHADRQTYIYPPLDKRCSPIISKICGTNNLLSKMKQVSIPSQSNAVAQGIEDDEIK